MDSFVSYWTERRPFGWKFFRRHQMSCEEFHDMMSSLTEGKHVVYTPEEIELRETLREYATNMMKNNPVCFENAYGAEMTTSKYKLFLNKNTSLFELYHNKK